MDCYFDAAGGHSHGRTPVLLYFRSLCLSLSVQKSRLLKSSASSYLARYNRGSFSAARGNPKVYCRPATSRAQVAPRPRNRSSRCVPCLKLRLLEALSDLAEALQPKLLLRPLDSRLCMKIDSSYSPFPAYVALLE